MGHGSRAAFARYVRDFVMVATSLHHLLNRSDRALAQQGVSESPRLARHFASSFMRAHLCFRASLARCLMVPFLNCRPTDHGSPLLFSPEAVCCVFDWLPSSSRFLSLAVVAIQQRHGGQFSGTFQMSGGSNSGTLSAQTTDTLRCPGLSDFTWSLVTSMGKQ
jgi:hypothetical protein